MVKSSTLEQRRQLGLCFKCGEKYSPRHEMAAENVPEIEDGEISLHALKGCPTNKIIKVEGLVGNRKLMELIDSGST